MRASVVFYGGNVLPEDLGWTRQGTLDATRSIDDGWFVQVLELGDHGPEPYGQFDYYSRPLSEFVGSSHFYAEWRLQTDGPSSEFTGVAPASVVLGGNEAGFYHFTISNTQVRFFRDVDLPVTLYDFAADSPHTFRLDLYGNNAYVFSIDSTQVEVGVPVATYPDPTASIVWGGGYYLHRNTNRWDYIEFGEVPEPAGAALFLAGAVWMGRRRKPQPRGRR